MIIFSKLTCMNYSLYLTQFLQTSLEDHEEEHPSVPCNIYNPFTDDRQEFSQLSVKVNVIKFQNSFKECFGLYSYQEYKPISMLASGTYTFNVY